MTGYRDLAAERAIVAGLDLPLERSGCSDPIRCRTGRAAAWSRVRLGGIDTMRFSTELLPLLAGQPGVAVEVTGEPADYREASDSLRIGVSAERGRRRRRLVRPRHHHQRRGPARSRSPTCSLALSRGESHLLLADGAYFCLDKPELQALARLIERGPGAAGRCRAARCGSAGSRPGCGTS